MTLSELLSFDKECETQYLFCGETGDPLQAPSCQNKKLQDNFEHSHHESGGNALKIIPKRQNSSA